MAPTAAAAGNEAADAALFATDVPLDLELRIDEAHFCRNPTRAGCADAEGVLRYRDADGTDVPIAVRVRSRGRWRSETGGCPLPALFILFDSRTAAGTPFALAHSFPQTGPFRPGNVERRLPGMFFAGSGTVPGVGVPMVLISGKLAAERVGDYLPKPVS